VGIPKRNLPFLRLARNVRPRQRVPDGFVFYFIVCLIERALTFESGKMVFMFGASVDQA
jgi:hypothetical protein